MILNKIPFEKGTLETMVERLYQTMNSMEKQWSKNVKPASKEKIKILTEISGLEQQGKNIPAAYLFFLRAMGESDNGLLEQQWDGYAEADIDSVLEGYSLYEGDFFDRDEFMPFCLHWTESILFLKLTGEENPPVYHRHEELFSGSFENHLFQMAFQKAERTQFLYRIELAASQQQFRAILSASEQDIHSTKPMEFIEHILSPYPLEKMWFSDEIHFCGVSPEFIISVDLAWALNINISSDNHIIVQNMKENLLHLLGDLSVIYHLHK